MLLQDVSLFVQEKNSVELFSQLNILIKSDDNFICERDKKPLTVSERNYE